MPDDRLIHRRLGRGQRTTSLTDFEFRVWMQYELSADDYGVMLRSAAPIQTDNARFAKESAAKVLRALNHCVEVRLIVPFEHQGLQYVCQPDWQDFQKVRYPRDAHQPCPPAEVLQICTSATQELFSRHPRSGSGNPPQDSGERSEIDPCLPHARVRETANGLRQEADGERRTAAIARRGIGGGALLGGSYAEHAKHGACNDRGLCVPAFLHREFLGKAHGDEAHVRAFYERTLAELAPGVIPGDEPLDFWRAAWKRVHGSTQQKTGLIDRMRDSDRAAAAMLDARGGRR